MTNMVNIDERAGSFEPMQVVFRGEEFTLGETALQLFSAASLYSSSGLKESESQTAYALRLLEPMLRELSPGIAAKIDEQPLTPPEQFAFMGVLTEVVKRIGAIRFRATEG